MPPTAARLPVCGAYSQGQPARRSVPCWPERRGRI